MKMCLIWSYWILKWMKNEGILNFYLHAKNQRRTVRVKFIMNFIKRFTYISGKIIKPYLTLLYNTNINLHKLRPCGNDSY